MDFGSPIFQSGILPVFAAFVLTGAIRMAAGASRGPALAGASVGLAAILAYVMILTWPAWPPGQSMQKLAYIFAAALALGAVADAVPAPRSLRRSGGATALPSALRARTRRARSQQAPWRTQRAR
mgnify:CR=1 FL=1